MQTPSVFVQHCTKAVANCISFSMWCLLCFRWKIWQTKKYFVKVHWGLTYDILLHRHLGEPSLEPYITLDGKRKTIFTWLGIVHNFIQALGCVSACIFLFKSTLYFQHTFIGTPFGRHVDEPLSESYITLAGKRKTIFTNTCLGITLYRHLVLYVCATCATCSQYKFTWLKVS